MPDLTWTCIWFVLGFSLTFLLVDLVLAQRRRRRWREQDAQRDRRWREYQARLARGWSDHDGY